MSDYTAFRDPFGPVEAPPPEPFTLSPPRPIATPAEAPDVEAGSWTFTVEGEPVPKLSGQIVRFGKHMSLKANPKTRRYEDVVRQVAAVAWAGRPLLRERAVELTIIFYREPPASASKRLRAQMLAGELKPISKPDCTNYAKAFEDGLKGIVIADDALVTDLVVRKRYATAARVECTVAW